jgi:hypothetical protein
LGVRAVLAEWARAMTWSAAERTRRGQPLGREGSDGAEVGMRVVPPYLERTPIRSTSDHRNSVSHEALGKAGRQEKTLGGYRGANQEACKSLRRKADGIIRGDRGQTGPE